MWKVKPKESDYQLVQDHQVSYQDDEDDDDWGFDSKDMQWQMSGDQAAEDLDRAYDLDFDDDYQEEEEYKKPYHPEFHGFESQ